MSEVPPANVSANGVTNSQSADSVEQTPGHKVFAGNLAYNTTDQGLKAFFAPVANEIISAQVILRGTRSAGYGFVSLTTLEAAQKAVEALDKQELDGRNIIIEIAKPSDQKDKERTEKRAKRRAGRTRSRAPPGEVSEVEANGDSDKAADAPATGDAEKPKKKKKKSIRKPRVKKSADGQTDATVEGADAPPVAPTESTESVSAKRQPRQKREKRPPRPAGEEPVGEPSKNMIFVANLGFNIDDAGLAELFTSAGITVNSARIVRRKWGQPRRSKGYGFVDVGSEEEQKKALATLQGKDVGGREIAVKIAVNTPKEEDETPNGPASDASPEATIVAK